VFLKSEGERLRFSLTLFIELGTEFYHVSVITGKCRQPAVAGDVQGFIDLR